MNLDEIGKKLLADGGEPFCRIVAGQQKRGALDSGSSRVDMGDGDRVSTRGEQLARLHHDAVGSAVVNVGGIADQKDTHGPGGG